MPKLVDADDLPCHRLLMPAKHEQAVAQLCSMPQLRLGMFLMSASDAQQLAMPTRIPQQDVTSRD